MLHLNRSFVILVLAALLAACAGPAAAPTATPVPPTTTPVPPTPTAETIPVPLATEMVIPPKMLYSGDGQYKVGSKDFAVQDGDETLNISAFYPGLNATAPDTAHGPYPLVVFSPGMSTNPLMYMNWLGPIASHGFVILTSTPRGENYPEFWAGAATRPLDIRRTIDYAGKLTAPDGQLAGMIDTERIGVVGHSSGGWTALMEGGAQMDLGWCAAHPDLVARLPISNCPQFVPHQQEIAAMLGLKSAPAGMWPPMSDPRVDAVIAVSPDGDIWGAEYGGVAGVKVPTLIMAGSADSINAPELCAYPIYEHLGSTKKTLVVFEQGSHDLGWSVYRNAITHIMTAFLLAEVKGDTEAAKALLPENVAIPGVKYETTAYGAAPTAKLDDATVAKIEALVAKTMTENEIPGYALGIVKDGRIVYTQGFGIERVGGDKPVTPHTAFDTGSVGKTATATAIMQLVAEGKIDRDVPVTDYLPYFKLGDARYEDITVRHLITHRSGLPANPVDWFPLPVEYDDGALERYVRSMDKIGLLFPPDKGWSFSETGFIVLADIAAKVSGQTFEEYLQEHIIGPLGMDDTLLIVHEADQEHIASPHVRNDSGEVAVDDISFYRRQYAAARPLTSSITDMVRYAAAHLNHGEFEGTRILPATTYDAMWEPISDQPVSAGPVITPLFGKYGMGWALGQIDGHRIVQHFGDEPGYGALLLLAPDDNVALVMSSNYFDEAEFNLSAWEAAVQVMQMILTEGQ